MKSEILVRLVTLAMKNKLVFVEFGHKAVRPPSFLPWPIPIRKSIEVREGGMLMQEKNRRREDGYVRGREGTSYCYINS